MNGNYLLDTNIVIALFLPEETVQVRLEGAEQVFIPAVVLGELYFGAGKSGRPSANVAASTSSPRAGLCSTATPKWPGSTV